MHSLFTNVNSALNLYGGEKQNTKPTTQIKIVCTHFITKASGEKKWIRIGFITANSQCLCGLTESFHKILLAMKILMDAFSPIFFFLSRTNFSLAHCLSMRLTSLMHSFHTFRHSNAFTFDWNLINAVEILDLCWAELWLEAISYSIHSFNDSIAWLKSENESPVFSIHWIDWIQ